MNDVVLAALIGGACSIIVGTLTLIGVIITNNKSNHEMQRKAEIQQAVTAEQIAELTREVREHNNFARRMPVVENEIIHIHDDIDVLKHYHEKN